MSMEGRCWSVGKVEADREGGGLICVAVEDEGEREMRVGRGA